MRAALLHSDLVTEKKYWPSHITDGAEQIHWVWLRPVLFVTMSPLLTLVHVVFHVQTVAISI